MSGPNPTVDNEAERRAHDEYIAKLTNSLRRPTMNPRPPPNSPTILSQESAWPRSGGDGDRVTGIEGKDTKAARRATENESLLDGFVLLRLAQLINYDVHYIGMRHNSADRQSGNRKSESQVELTPAENLPNGASQTTCEALESGDGGKANSTGYVGARRDANNTPGKSMSAANERTLIDELAGFNPLQRCIDEWRWLNNLSGLLRVFFSLVAIMISVIKAISTILLCLLSRPDLRRRPGDIGIAYEASDVTMGWIVLALINLSAMYTLFATVFDGHLIWNLLAQRIFLVSRRFQYKTMLSLVVFFYLEYIVNISFVNNLFDWPFELADDPKGFLNSKTSAYSIHNSYSVLFSLQVFVTDRHKGNVHLDILLTIFQFARGIIRVSPYVTINYVILCLIEHVKTIRNQTLLTDSLKKRQRLRMVVKSRRPKTAGSSGLSASDERRQPTTDAFYSFAAATAATDRRKRVVFVTQTSGISEQDHFNHSPAWSPNHLTTPHQKHQHQQANHNLDARSISPDSRLSPSSLSLASNRSVSSLSYTEVASYRSNSPAAPPPPVDETRTNYLKHIEDFDELESYITNLYIFTGRLNRLMSKQGLAIFFIVHNLTITCTLIVPEAISGGAPMASVVRLLVVVIAIVPFIWGQSLNAQLEQLSKQIDRIIIQEQFIGRKRDNLVRIRELLHDIRVNCGGMLNFNVETGIKYLVVAFASAFFIEQEGEFSLIRVAQVLRAHLSVASLAQMK